MYTARTTCVKTLKAMYLLIISISDYSKSHVRVCVCVLSSLCLECECTSQTRLSPMRRKITGCN